MRVWVVFFVLGRIIGNCKGIFVEYSRLEVGVRVYVCVYDFVYLVGIVVSINGKKQYRKCCLEVCVKCKEVNEKWVDRGKVVNKC